MTTTELQLLARLAASLCVMFEINYLPEDCEDIHPVSVADLRTVKLLLVSYGAEVPQELTHWLGKLNEVRPQ